MLREIALDTETTGLDPASGHRVVEIGCVEMVGRIRTGNVFHCYLNPERDMPQEAFAVHGLSAEFLAEKPVFADAAEAFLSFIGDAPLVIHNAAFDLRFLNAELTRIGALPIPEGRAIDTVMLARAMFPGSPASLDALCKRFEIDLAARTKHGALLDAELLTDVYLELTGGRQSALVLEETVVELAATTMGEPSTPRAARSFPPSDEELLAHAVFLAKLKHPLWLQ